MRRLIVIVIVVALVYFAVEGGQYGTHDLWAQRRQRLALEDSIRRLTRTVDSLQAYKKQLETDPALQEKLARENVGMVRGEKELLYQLGPPDTTRKPVKKP